MSKKISEIDPNLLRQAFGKWEEPLFFRFLLVLKVNRNFPFDTAEMKTYRLNFFNKSVAILLQETQGRM
ncbi:hypothetical protein [Anaerophaga thermohalophila]|uniref:hypothetical protein n=1 Tax=Anaerophaga thermohalophila TaxID=177400 RepID=UPI000237BECA|nr:hypothetical protein [Anaerophaga thermohalophila]